MATIQPPFYKRHLWLYLISALALFGGAGYVLRQRAMVREESRLNKVSLQQIAQLRPTTGTYDVSGGLLNYTYAQAVGFTNDKEKDTGTFDSFVPCLDPNTKQVVMLVEFKGESPRTLALHRDDPVANSIVGFFYEPSRVDAAIYKGFADRVYPVSKDTPVMELAGGVDPGKVKRNNILAMIVAVLVGGGPWLIMYRISRPKQRQKRFSERYPDRKVY